MTPRHEDADAGWTLTTLRIHFDQRFDALAETTKTALAAADRAVSKAELANDKRFDGVNEFRSSLSDQQRTLMPRAEVEALMRSIEQRIDVQGHTVDAKIASLAKMLDAIVAERQGIKGGYGYAVGIAGLVLTLFSLLMVLWKFGGGFVEVVKP